ncbi:RNA polymerase sigma factor [Faecalibacter rhinopitheci]|uniref:RNA polymerase sigma factor n=1 Tax=Faecalibacter rhinopitheci TaxID=2779678 RepID=A0A8J7FQG2_9FLAO|nr:RNA polymerase sigma factor [Faecalibacter rhinopitheci]MBF0596353.1 RNA polymerase sigma factor [Faecalibacter rhinopitheci]MBQ0147751.1 RNA polymerase sigma factor [Candidatus Onthonaster equi]
MTLEEIIVDAKKGKRNAQNLLIELLWQQVYNYVNFKIRNEEEAEDITIETFTKVLSKLKLYNEDFDFKTWVISIAHNTMLDHIRKSQKLNISIDDGLNFLLINDSEKSPEDYLILQQDNDKVMKAIDLLPAKFKRIIELRFFEDKTYKEIAYELSLSLPNVKVRVLRARQLLAEVLEKEA